MTPDTIDIRYVAKLARIALTDDEIERFSKELGELLGHVRALEELDTASVPATAQVVESRNVLREDVERPCLDREVVLDGAPQRQGGVLSRAAHHRRMNAAEIARDVSAGRVSAAEITAATLAQVQAVDGEVGAYLTVLGEIARSCAARVDERIAAGERLALAGVPIAVKDNMCLEGARTTCASKILERWIAPYTATAVARLLEAGAIPIGKANCDEFAMGSSCENSALGITRNPYDLARVPGGSSGGSAAAVAAGEAAIGLGSDTGGSIREPAAFCNLVGFKPTYGRVSRYGLIAFASSLDQIGPLARTVEDAALAYDIMAGYDPMDATSLDRPVERAADSLRTDLTGLRVGIVREFDTKALGEPSDALYREAYRDLERLGAELVEVSLPTADYGLATYYLIAAR